MNSLEEILIKEELYLFLNFLFEKMPTGNFPQIAFSKKRGLERDYNIWLPGNKEENKNLYFIPDLIGFSGRVYENPFKSQHEQSFYICWAGIDIDGCVDANKIHEIIPEATIRQSKSGLGLHLFFRFENPVFCEQGTKGSVVKASLQPFVEKLQENGLSDYVCLHHGNIFWMITKNKQEVFFLSKKFIKFIVPEDESKFCQKMKIDDIFKDFDNLIINLNLNAKGNALCNLLLKRGLISSPDAFLEPHQIYVKEWFENLKNTPFAFSTQSPMKSNKKHTNGKVWVEDKFFCIYCSKDNFIVKKIRIID